MCGRFTLRTPANEIAALFDVAVPSLRPRYNIAPTQAVAAVRRDRRGERREWVLLRWGLIPFWADDPKIGYRTINARAETVATKPAFRQAFSRRRCLIPADGFYEWKQVGDRKQPYFIHRDDDRPFALAGLWERWRGDAGEIESCTILVSEAKGAIASIHDRMPVIVPPQRYDAWLDPNLGNRRELEAMLGAGAEEELEVRAVSTLVNKPANDLPECVAPIEPG